MDEEPKNSIDGIFEAVTREAADREDDLLLTEAEAKYGCTKSLRIVRQVPCLECVQLGGQIVERCGKCREGEHDREETIEIVVRPGVTQGTRISVLGKGNARRGRAPGNRYFVVTIEGAVTGGAHPYRASGQPPPRGESALSRAQNGSTTSAPKLFALMVLIAAGILIGLFAAGK
ncbi:hypothetical protein BH09MYX1_BH09MYX1_15240 [soil metagenome]